jgi:hypothetical protein
LHFKALKHQGEVHGWIRRKIAAITPAQLPSSLHTVATQRSVPPPTDAFWNASESSGWKVRTFKRSSWTKKEKDIDGDIQ